LAEQHHLIPDSAGFVVRHINHRHIHGDAPHDGGPLALQKHLTLIRQKSSKAIGVAHRKRGNAGLPFGHPGFGVADARPFRNGL
jgi:hypothetical protein